jgi:F-type H+-transporting ATPase subunit c
MKKKFVYAALSGMAMAITSTLAMAMEAAAPAAAPVAASGDYSKAIVVAISIFSAAMVMAAGTMTTALGMGHGLNGAVNAVGRNPEAQGKILTTMMVGLAMIESLAIYALVIALVVIYANPLLKIIGG